MLNCNNLIIIFYIKYFLLNISNKINARFASSGVTNRMSFKKADSFFLIGSSTILVVAFSVEACLSCCF